jgi:hypothetical protein
MSQRAAILAIAVCAACAASPLAAAETPDSRTAGLRGPQPAPDTAPNVAPQPVPLGVPDARPRRYSLHRDYGEQPDRTVLPPEFFLTSPPVPDPEPAADTPARDRWGRAVQTPEPGSPTLDSASSPSPSA